jgi:hypothetical protein
MDGAEVLPVESNMDPEVLQQVLDELFPALEAMESQGAAILQLLKDRDIVNEEDFAALREKAGNASSVRWLGTRLRVKHILEGASRAAEMAQEKRAQPAAPKPDDQTPAANKQARQPGKDQPAKTELDKVEVQPEGQENPAEKKTAGKDADLKAKAEGGPVEQKANKDHTAETEQQNKPEKSDNPAKSNAA